MKKALFIISIGILFSSLSVAQSRAKAFEAGSADTTHIAVNKHGGWQFVSPYLTPIGKDSARLEMIVQHDRTIDWTQKQLVARITRRNMIPANAQTVLCNLITLAFKLSIDPNGNCYLQQVSGKLPDDNPLAIPIRAKYKRN